MISAKHSQLEYTTSGHVLIDLGSASGTYVNGKPISREKLFSGDRVQIGCFVFRYEGDRLTRADSSTAISVEACEISKQVGTATLLENLTFTLRSGEFVGLIGPSGAGKTTLLDALNGLRPATGGEVYLNDDSLYDEYSRLRHHIGYVPQDDIIHRELTVQDALSFAARLRLPSDSTADELERVVADTLETLDLKNRKDVLISHLSGGQRKRVSVGVELLNRPGVLFLDEPTSGLDPGTESRLMKLFRRLADQGQTVVCTTHVMENIDLFDKIVVLARGGKLAFFGPPQLAKEFFGITKFCDLYDRIEDLDPTEWQTRYRTSTLFREYVEPTIRHRSRASSRVPRRLTPARGVSAVIQCLTLIHRYLKLMWADRATLLVTLAQPVIITALICTVYREINSINFLLVISSIWFGCSGAAQQIVKEKSIYRRERMVNMRLDSYLLSKFVPLMGLAALQSLLMLFVLNVMEDVEGEVHRYLLVFLLSAWNGVGIGLFISAVASNGDKAMSIVPLSLIPQIILAGVLVPLPEMERPVQIAAMFTSARWANQACEAIVFDGREINAEILETEGNIRPIWNLYPQEDFARRDGMQKFVAERSGEIINRETRMWIACGVLASFLACFGGATCIALRRQDTL